MSNPVILFVIVYAPLLVILLITVLLLLIEDVPSLLMSKLSSFDFLFLAVFFFVSVEL